MSRDVISREERKKQLENDITKKEATEQKPEQIQEKATEIQIANNQKEHRHIYKKPHKTVKEIREELKAITEAPKQDNITNTSK